MIIETSCLTPITRSVSESDTFLSCFQENFLNDILMYGDRGSFGWYIGIPETDKNFQLKLDFYDDLVKLILFFLSIWKKCTGKNNLQNFFFSLQIFLIQNLIDK